MTNGIAARGNLPLTSDPLEEKFEERLEDTLALCLSGGGYRAMLFHLGTLWYLNDAGYLRKLDRVSSVSGGSITAGVLALRCNRLTFDAAGKATNFNMAWPSARSGVTSTRPRSRRRRSRMPGESRP